MERPLRVVMVFKLGVRSLIRKERARDRILGMRERKERRRGRRKEGREKRREGRGGGRRVRRRRAVRILPTDPLPGSLLLCFPSWVAHLGTCFPVFPCAALGLRERSAPWGAAVSLGLQHRPLPPAWDAEGPPPLPPSSPCQGKKRNRTSLLKKPRKQEHGSLGSRSLGFYGEMGLPLEEPSREAGRAPRGGREGGRRKLHWLGHCTGRNQKWHLGGAFRGRQPHSPAGGGHSRSEMPKQEMRCNL